MACDHIETTLHSNHIYCFSTEQNRLPCLAHVVNLAIADFMSVITKIAHMETTTAIWEFDPMLPLNQILGDSLDVVAAIWTLAINIQASGQRIAYFERLQKEYGIDIPLKIPLHSNVRWGTADGMLACSYHLRQVRLFFIIRHCSNSNNRPLIYL
jgi:hypothetical protein